MSKKVLSKSEERESAMVQAFEILLNRSLSKYNQNLRYGVFYSGNWLSESGASTDYAWFHPNALSGKKIVKNENLMLLDAYPSYPSLQFDSSLSLFDINKGEMLPTAFEKDLREILMHHSGIIVGHQLGYLMEKHSLSTLPEEALYVYQARMASNGTLFDALRVATGIGRGPQYKLISYKEEIDEEAEALISEVTDTKVHSHLRAFCSSESHELSFCSPDDLENFMEDDVEDYKEMGYKRIAYWTGAVNQFEITIVQDMITPNI